MNPFSYRDLRLHAEDVDLAALADAVGTPCYVYSRAAIEHGFHAFDHAFGAHPHRVCYAVKANSNLAVLNVLARLGAGFDIVSGGELQRVLAAGGDAARIVFSGVGKTESEMHAALAAGVSCFNVESESELEQLDRVAGGIGKKAPVSLRVNPDVDAATHPYIATGLKQSKFGIPIERAVNAFQHARALAHIKILGVDCHIGSQITNFAPFADAVQRLLTLVDELAAAGIALRHIDVGGGLGIRYDNEEVTSPGEYVAALIDMLHRDRRRAPPEVWIEPGRAIVGNAGLLLTRVLYLKLEGEHNFAVVDAAMNDLLRPALYNAWHDITPVRVDAPRTLRRYDVVGPVCESADFLGRDRELGIEAGDLLAVVSAGAYGAVMSSNYNTRPRPPEVMVDGARWHVVRRRETVEELMALESLVPQSKP